VIFSAPYRLDEPLAKHTTWKIGGPAKYMAFPETLDHLDEIAQFLQKTKTPYAILGNGSNLLVPDEGFDGLVIKTTRLPSFIKQLDAERVQVSASILNAKAVRTVAELGLAGIEFLSGVPGTIGGAVIMNAGTGEGWIDQVVTEVRTYHLSEGLKEYKQDQLRYAYRKQSYLSDREIVLEAFFQLRKDDPEAIKKRIMEGTRRRKDAQPLDLPSCGSVFRNPPGKKAWELIDQAGLRGMAKGGAQISEKHSNFIVNNGGAKMMDVIFLIRLAKEAVEHQSGIKLEEEVVSLEPRVL
jgi:UDP-N-acetylmuramate dehydrogenase